MSEAELNLQVPRGYNIGGERGQRAPIGNEATVGDARVDGDAAVEQLEVGNNEHDVENEVNVLPVPPAAAKPRNIRDRATLRTPARYQINLVEYKVPMTYQEAISCPEAEKWVEAIEDELQTHQKNGTWTIVPRIPDEKLIDSKRMFKAIRDEKGSVY